MKKYSFLILIVIVSFFASCSKEENNGQDEMMPSKSFTYTDTLKIFSDDNLSSVTLAISSNDLEAFEDARSSLALLTDEESLDIDNNENLNEVNETLSKENSIQQNIDISFDILKIDSKSKVIRLGRKDVSLKSLTTIPELHSYSYSCIEADYDFFVKYIHNGSSFYGLTVYMGHKESWLSNWDYNFPQSYGGSSQNNSIYANPWNRNSPTWKLGAHCDTDLGPSLNYQVILIARN
jgi:hypothetical protein